MLENPGLSLEGIQKFFCSSRIVIRSSCHAESCKATSCAGAFLSLLNVNSMNTSEVADSINKAISSYGNALPDNQTLLHKILQYVGVTGVIMTRSLTNGNLY